MHVTAVTAPVAETLLANIQGIELGETEYAVTTPELENHRVHSAVQSQAVIPAYPDLVCGHLYGITMHRYTLEVVELFSDVFS